MTPSPDPGANPDALGRVPSSAEKLRANTWALLAHLLATPPDAQLLGRLARIEDEHGEPEDLLGAAWLMLGAAAGRASPAALDNEYHALFIGVGHGELLPYASWYLTGFLMEKPLAMLRADLARLGFERQDSVSEPEDHAAAVCDVMAMLAGDDEPAEVAEQAAFFGRHVAPWLGRFFRQLQEARSADFYRAVGQLGEQFLEVESKYLNKPLPPVTRDDRAMETKVI